MSEIDVVYIVGERSQCNNNELRMSLRSLERYGKNVGRVYVIGTTEKLDWLNPENVSVINIPNVSKDKHKNINNCLIEFVKNYTTKDFVVMHDDFFITKDIDLSTFGYSSDEDLWYKYTTKYREMTIVYTYFMCMYNSHRIKNYDTCLPFRFEYDKILRILPFIETSQYEPCKTGVMARSVYGNIYNLPIQELPNRKFWTLDSLILIKQYRHDENPYTFSVSADSMMRGTLQYLYNEYDFKSKYEK